MDIQMCNKCENRFNQQQGQLRLLDMCEDCKQKHVLAILGPECENPQ